MNLTNIMQMERGCTQKKHIFYSFTYIKFTYIYINYKCIYESYKSDRPNSSVYGYILN